MARDKAAAANMTNTIQVVQLVPELFQKKSLGEHRKLALACHSYPTVHELDQPAMNNLAISQCCFSENNRLQEKSKASTCNCSILTSLCSS